MVVAFAERLRAAQAGDEVAFSELFCDVQPLLLRYLRSLAGTGAAEDIAADTWVAVVRDLQRFSGDDVRGFRAWVLSIARMRWIDDVRRRSRRPEQLVADAPEAGVADDVAVTVERNAGTDWAMGVLDLLPSDQREVLVLRVIADLSVSEVAAVVGKSPG
ncbi:MAG: RNA polymerase sigma factor, partial [Frankiales bacterium]|nr:RNA polymerase sigma factor [Frankiales bacterium]